MLYNEKQIRVFIVDNEFLLKGKKTEHNFELQ
jgi:hypothetical protein